MEHIHIVSKRYIPLETIRQIPQVKGLDKTRHFIYKLCFKLASISGNECELSLNECMNLGKFFNKADRNTKRKWKPIERALLRAKEFGLIDFKWNFREISNIEQKKENLSVNLFHEISNPIYDSDGRLEEIYYKYINSVQIKRNYALNNTTQVELPFALEKQEPKREQKAMKVQF
jgi:hypothetical protein